MLSGKLNKRIWVIVLTLMLCLSTAAAQNRGALRGRVVDEKGGVVIGANVVLVDANGVEKVTVTNNEGIYSFAGLASGIYTLRANARGFSTYENLAEIPADRKEPLNLDVKLTVAVQKQEVTVTSETPALSTEPGNNAGALILKSADLDALPDDPDDLADALQALAGPWRTSPPTCTPTGASSTSTAFPAARYLLNPPFARSESTKIPFPRSTIAWASGELRS